MSPGKVGTTIFSCAIYIVSFSRSYFLGCPLAKVLMLTSHSHLNPCHYHMLVREKFHELTCKCGCSCFTEHTVGEIVLWYIDDRIFPVKVTAVGLFVYQAVPLKT